MNDTYTGNSDDYQYGSYFDAVIQEAEKNMACLKMISSTTVIRFHRIRPKLSSKYAGCFDNTAYFPVSDYDGQTAQGASVAMDPSTGAVRGLVGRVSPSSATFRSFNHATQASQALVQRLPLVVYSPAVASGYAITKELPNTVQDYDGYSPTNYAGIETADLPMYQALTNCIILQLFIC